MSGSIGSTPEIKLLSSIFSDFGYVSPKMEVSRAAKREVRVCTLGIYSKQLPLMSKEGWHCTDRSGAYKGRRRPPTTAPHQ